MIAPQIADRFTLVWIGGESYPAGGWEYNFNIDPVAAQFVFNETTVPIWQVGRAVNGTCLISVSELQAFVAPAGAINAWLCGKLMESSKRLSGVLNTGETWTLGDSPLVVLTALTDCVPSRFPRTYLTSAQARARSKRFSRRGLDRTVLTRRAARAGKFASTRASTHASDFFAKLRLNSSTGRI